MHRRGCRPLRGIPGNTRAGRPPPSKHGRAETPRTFRESTQERRAHQTRPPSAVGSYFTNARPALGQRGPSCPAPAPELSTSGGQRRLMRGGSSLGGRQASGAETEEQHLARSPGRGQCSFRGLVSQRG